MASLVSIDGNSFELADTETLIGRGGRDLGDPPKVDVGPLLGGPTCSRRHARVVRRGGQWVLRVEAEARNPSFLDGKRVPGGEEAVLADGASIQIGDVVLTFRAPVAAERRTDMTMMEGNGHGDDDAGGRTMIEAAPPPLVSAQAAPTPVVAAAPVAKPTPMPVAAAKPIAPIVAPAPLPATQQQRANADWAARLPERSLAVGALGAAEVKRVNPFRGLMVDERTWADAHDYHRTQSRLHLLSAHGFGVVEGLEVVADPLGTGAVVVRPGLAVDAQGRSIFLRKEQRVDVSSSAGGMTFITLRLREEPAAPQRYWSEADEFTRIVESAEVAAVGTPPTAPSLELARFVQVGSVVRDAPNPLDPRSGEIDLRFRERVAVRPRPDLAVAQIVPTEAESNGSGPGASHRFGLRLLLREIGLTTPYRARWAGVCRLGEPLPPVSVLYLTALGGFTVSESTATRLRDFLAGGGVLFADACSQGRIGEFAAAVDALATSVGAALQPVARWHPLLLARNVFTAPPTLGLSGVRLLEGGGIVLSTADYGCAWQGGGPESPLAREDVRAALELGVNVAVFARQRQRPLEVVDLEA